MLPFGGGEVAAYSRKTYSYLFALLTALSFSCSIHE